MRTGPLIALLLVPLLAVATPKPYHAEYAVSRNGSAQATATVNYSPAADGRWQLSSRTKGSQGMAALVGFDSDENSILRWNGDQPETIDYRFSQKAAWNSKQRSVKVDAAGGRVTSVDKDKTYSLTYQPGVLDQNAVNIALINDLAAGKRGDLVYTVVNKGAVAAQRYHVVGEVTLPTKLGSQRTIKVERIRDNAGGRSTTLWFGVDQGFIPLRMEQREPNGENIDMRISRLGA